MLKKIYRIFLVIIVLAGILFFTVVPGIVQKQMNGINEQPPIQIPEKIEKLHEQLTIVDLHCDALLWENNLLQRNERGHVDIPRMLEGNIGIQAFTIVTKFPATTSGEGVGTGMDLITPLAISQLWPVKSWFSLKERALYQIEKLNDFSIKSGGELTLIKTKDDLKSYLIRRKTDRDIAAGFLGIEGAHALEDDVENVDVFFNAGVRIMAPTHFFDTEMGGSAHGISRGGLTEKGRQMIKRMQELGMLVDLAHASAKTITDVTKMAKIPVVVSHTGVDGTCESVRNLSDAQLIQVAKTGGVIGIGFWPQSTCGKNVESIVRAIRHAVDVVGIDYVALGSDYDGAVSVPFDASRMVLLTNALYKSGFTEGDIAKIMGKNTIRVLQRVLPN